MGRVLWLSIIESSKHGCTARKPCNLSIFQDKIYTFYSRNNFIKKWNPKIIELTAFSGFLCHPCTIMRPNNKVKNDGKIYFYYINTNEIQGELSCENMIFTCENNTLSSHVKTSPLLLISYPNLTLFYWVRDNIAMAT